jgi:hypothetical protein
MRGSKILSLKGVATAGDYSVFGTNQIARDLVVLFSTFETLKTENTSLTRKLLLEKATQLTGMFALANAALQVYEATLDLIKKENAVQWSATPQGGAQKLYQNLERLVS